MHHQNTTQDRDSALEIKARTIESDDTEIASWEEKIAELQSEISRRRAELKQAKVEKLKCQWTTKILGVFSGS